MAQHKQRRWSRLTALTVTTALTVGVLVATSTSAATAADPGVPVVPRVDSFTSGAGTFTLTSGSRIIVDVATAGTSSTGPDSKLFVETTLLQTATSLASQFRAASGLALPLVTGGTADADDVLLSLATSSSQGVEGYRLTTSSTTGASITAATSAGAFYGGQTLLQRLRVGAWSAPVGTIDDVPDTAHRAVSVDVARNFWTVAELKDLIRRMGALKVNALQIHFNENEAFRLYSTNPAYSGLAPSSASYRYSRADIDTLVAFAKAYHVTIIPEIDTPYHAGALTRLDSSRSFAPQCGSQFFDTLDITNASVRSWTVGLYEEFLSWFPGDYFHVGNDEVPLTLNSCGYVSDTGKSIEQWQTEFVNQLDATVNAAGKTTMMWANGPDILPNTDVTFVNFGSVSNAAFLRGEGYKVVDTAWGGSGYQRFFIIPGMIRDSRTASEAQIYGWTWPGGTNNLGQQLAIWMDFANTEDNYSAVDLYSARLATFAERVWATTSPSITAAQFASRWAAIGDAVGVAARPAATVNTTTPALKYTFDAAVPLSTNEFTSPPTGFASTGSVALHAVRGAGGTPSTVTGRSGTGSAVKFGGSAHQTLTIGDGRKPSAWSASLWVNPATSTADTSLVSGWQSALKLSQYQTTNKVGVTVFGVGDYSVDYTAPTATWTHLAFVSTGTQVQIYANGALEGTINAAVPYPGSGGIGGQRSINGSIDDVAVYYGALTASQVAALAQQ
ncbi:family 20 glycosylhydrolase [Microbacterium sp. PMB16]|uniref:family 20 glycosylhydrolase n=1 Tax=Microbacterium sp. PMB16 TaxID=3120157 RepID=UPI003F4C9BFB